MEYYQVDALVVLQKSRPDLFVVPWSKVPPNLLSQSGNLFYSELLGPYMIQKREAKLKPGFRSSPLLPKVLCIIDISGSVSDDEMKYFFRRNRWYRSSRCRCLCSTSRYTSIFIL